MTIDTKPLPLVILGFDAGDPDFIQRWTREGYLPTIVSVMRRGCWGRSSGPEQICEFGTGLSLFSGISRSRHGYYNFRQLKPGTYDLQAVTPRDMDALPFWSSLCGRNMKIAIIDAPEVYTQAGLQGIQLANWATHQPAFPKLPASAEPGWLLKDVHRIFGPQMAISEFRLNSSFHEDRQIYYQVLERIQKKGVLCRYLLSQDHFDLVVIIFSEAHTAGHRFWKYRPEAQPTGKATEENELTHAIRDVYQAIDREMGLLLAQLPNEANIFIVSSLGLKDQYPTTGLVEAFCRQLGYQATAGPAPFSLNPLSSVRRMVPHSFRVALSHHLPLRLQEWLLADHFRNGTDWQKTAAFAIPSLYTSFVRVNLRGREPQGIVKPGTEYEALLDRFEADLKQLIDPQAGERAVNEVARVSKLFGGGPPAALPDLFIEWKTSSHFMQRVIHPRAELMQPKPSYFRDSWHSFNGFVAAAGPHIQPRDAIADVSLLDLAPTFLTLMGEPVPEKMTGQVIRAMIRG